MKNIPISRKPVAPVQAANGTSEFTPAATVPISKAQGTILVAIAAAPHPSLVTYLGSVLKREPVREIVIIGNAIFTEELKQLNLDIYALLGKLGSSVSLQMKSVSSFEEAAIDEAISKSVAEGESIHALICSPAYSTDAGSSANVMSFDRDELDIGWNSSVGFLHSTAKSALPRFRPNAPGLFLVTSPVERSPMAILNNTGVRALMTLLVEANTARDITIDYAENVILPEAEPEVKPEASNGRPPALDVTSSSRNGERSAPESPTKMWALYSDVLVD